MRWSESVTLEFVKIYLRHECLWNPQNPGYKTKFARENAYTEICSEFRSSTSKNMSIPEVKIKIKNLRTTYIQQVHKILQKSSPDFIYEPSLVWFHEMDRCLKHLPINRHSSSYSSSKQETPEVDSSSQLIWVGPDTQNESAEEPNPDPLISQDNEVNGEYESDQESSIKIEHNPSPVYKTKKKKIKHRNSVYCMPDSNTETREDEFDIYGKYIASQLRQMNLQKALRLQLEIQSLVSKARISDM